MLLDEAAEHRDAETRPNPILGHLRGQFGEAISIDEAKDEDRAEALAYLGLEALAGGEDDAAMELLRRAGECGDGRGSLAALAEAELSHLRAEGAEGDGPP